MTGKAGAGKGSGAGNNLGQTHPINIGANLYGVAACLAFLRMIFIFEIHHRYSIPTVVELCGSRVNTTGNFCKGTPINAVQWVLAIFDQPN